MRATMTDVQQALEQLGQHADGDGARSFTFASTRDGESTDHESLSERDNDHDDEEDGEDWYRSTRARLAERARQQVAEARAAEAAAKGKARARWDDTDEDESSWLGRRGTGTAFARVAPVRLEDVAIVGCQGFGAEHGEDLTALLGERLRLQ